MKDSNTSNIPSRREDRGVYGAEIGSLPIVSTWRSHMTGVGRFTTCGVQLPPAPLWPIVGQWYRTSTGYDLARA